MSVNFNTILSDEVEIFRSEKNPNNVVGEFRYIEYETKKDDKESINTLTFNINTYFFKPRCYKDLEKTFINDIIEQCKYIQKWNKKDSIETIVPVINQLSNHIFICNNISGANFIVCKENGYFINEIKHSSTFEYIDQEGNDTYPIGIIGNTYYVYTTDYIDDDKLLIGYKGKQPEQSGGVYYKYNEKVFFDINDTDNYFRVLEIVNE